MLEACTEEKERKKAIFKKVAASVMRADSFFYRFYSFLTAY
jgi:hypothetical protein